MHVVPLAEPADKYDSLPFEALWRTHPFLLPCLCVAAFMVVDWCLAFFLLKESKEDVTFSRADYGAVEAKEWTSDRVGACRKGQTRFGEG